MLRLPPKTRRDDLAAASDRVVLADGTIMEVPRNNLAAAKELEAAEKAARRRMAERRASRLAPRAPGVA